MVQPLITRNIPAEFMTVNHYIFGQVKVSNTGMLGLLYDATTSFVELNDASVARIVKPDKIINYATLMWLVKDQIDYAAFFFSLAAAGQGTYLMSTKSEKAD